MFAEERLDTGLIIYGTSGGPEFSTDVVVLGNGKEHRNQNWESARGQWDYGDRKLPDTELQTILKFFRARKGKAVGFRFKDWGDYQADATEGILGETGKGTGDATYLLYKKYLSGGDTDLRRIYKPVTGTVKVFVNGVLRPTIGAGAYAVDYTTGTVTIAVDAVGGLPQASDDVTWTGEFDVPVRFDTDKIAARFDSAHTIAYGVLGQKFFYLPSLPLVELTDPE